VPDFVLAAPDHEQADQHREAICPGHLPRAGNSYNRRLHDAMVNHLALFNEAETSFGPESFVGEAYPRRPPDVKADFIKGKLLSI
jgi:hypothetical protein